jgi:hypothetical protein
MQPLDLLREYTDFSALKVVKEAVDGGVDDTLIGGIFLQGNIDNRNGRNYPTDMLAESVNKYVREKVDTKRALGELNHPPGIEINLDRVALIITELAMDGNNGRGKAKLLSTPKGSIAKSLVEGGCSFGVSTRGLGKVDKDASGKNIVSNFDLVAIDIVADPSAPDAFVNAVNEGLQYYLDESTNQIKVVNHKDALVEHTAKLDNIYSILSEIKEGLSVLPKKQEEKNKTIVEILTTGLGKI